MSDLSATIQRGTDQMAEGYQALARVRATNRARKDAAVRAMTASLGDAAKAFKQYGSWKDAKAAEDDEKSAMEAGRLGRIEGGDAGELTALDAYKPATLAGYKIATERRDAATKRAQDAGEQKYREVQMAHIQAMDTQAAEKQGKEDSEDARRRTGLKAASALWPDEPAPTDDAAMPAPGATLRAASPAAQERQRQVHAIKALMAADAIDPKDATSRLVQLSQQARQEEKDVRESADKAAAEKGRNDRSASSIAVQRQNADTAAKRGEAYASHLKADEENDAAGVRLRGEANEIAERSRQDRFNIAQNHDNVALARTIGDQARADYEDELKTLDADKKLAQSRMWRPGEDKAAILSGITLKENALKAAHGRLLDVLKTLPQPQPMQGPAQGGAPAQPHQMSDAELDAAIKLAEGAPK